MAWQNPYTRYRLLGMQPNTSIEPYSTIEQCFIRKEHRCGKFFGASKSCFIACPTEDELEPILELMVEKLTKIGIEPIIAVKERAYGQDIFCTKICGKIIESRFCIVILNDGVQNRINIPNPNVYYEYGLMTSLKKHIIPLQKDDLKLAFNIQSYDTIKYNPKNIASELDRAIKDAIKITETREIDEKSAFLPEKTILRKFELAGFELKDEKWILSDVINDTNYKGFGHFENQYYLFLGKIDDDKNAQEYLDDMGVVIYRTLKVINGYEQKCRSLNDELSNIKQNSQKLSSEAIFLRNSEKLTETLRETEKRLELLSNIYFGFIVNPNVNMENFISKAEELIHQSKRFTLTISAGDTIVINDLTIDLSTEKH